MPAVETPVVTLATAVDMARGLYKQIIYDE